MPDYYNEMDPFAAQWLRTLISAGSIAAGEVDERSIADVRQHDVRGRGACHFFAGIGGWPYALSLAGWPDDRPVWTGSCPCQPFSSAGKQSGAADDRHLWPQWFRLIRKCRPDTIFGEQVAAAVGFGWIDRVFADLEAEGYACGATVLGAHSVGAPHIRQRLFWVADSDEDRSRSRPENAGRQTRDGFVGGSSWLGDTESEQMGRTGQSWQDSVWLPCLDGKARRVEPGVFPLAHGVPARVGRLRGYGNAIVPQVAAEFVRAFLDA